MTATSPPLLVPRGGLLVVHAHPDDETLTTGGLLATWAASGEHVTLVTCTRGERGEVIGSALAHLEGDGSALAAHRETELAAAVRALGIPEHHYLDELPGPSAAPEPARPVRYEDSGMAWVGGDAPGVSGLAGTAAVVPADALVAGDVEDQAAVLAELVRRRRPAVVVTYEPGGGYGHPDHVRAHEITMRALGLARAGSSQSEAHRPREVWWAVVPVDVVRESRAALGASVERGSLDGGGAVLPAPDGPLPAMAVEARDVAVVLDTRPVLDRVEEALRAHATQVHRVARLAAPAGARAGLVGAYALSNDVLVPWLGTEYYARASEENSAGPVQPVPSVER